ncbi:MAG: 7-carboxy-7-deazaguanine synthase [Planctomycetaceae bacterium]
MTYAVKELVYTLQGEGAQTGRAAVFCRFAGCNLWTGEEADRDQAVCRFCDTDLVGTDGPGGGRFECALALAETIERIWDCGARSPAAEAFARGAGSRPFVVFTGGEPALQLDRDLVDELHSRGFEIAIETNGTLDLPAGIDWVCVSPKAGTVLRVVAGDELKLVHPQAGAEPERYAKLAFRRFYLQPLDGPERAAHTRETVAYCLSHPQWRISLQTHKILGIP